MGFAHGNETEQPGTHVHPPALFSHLWHKCGSVWKD